MSRIVTLEVENVKRLHAVEIRPDGNLVVIGGRNGQGKTSLLDSIEWALAGGRIDGRPLRNGAHRGRITVETEELVVTRRFVASGKSYLEVLARDTGEKLASPQAILDKLYGRLSFDPLAFMRAAPKEQIETLRALVGLDFRDLDARRATSYAERTATNRRLREEQARLDAMPRRDDAPDEPPAVAELLERRNEISARGEARRVKGQEEAIARREHELAVEVLVEAERALSAAQQAVQDARAKVNDRQAHADALRREFESMPAPGDVSEVQSQIDEASTVAVAVREKRDYAEQAKRVRSIQEAARALTDSIEEIDMEKQQRVTDAHFPVPGLSLSEDGVLFEGLPVAQASGAEQLRISVAMGIALNPKLRVLLVRDGSLLDDDSLALLRDLADTHQAQVWLERVGHGAEVSVVIEDGEVSDAPAPEDPA